MMKEPHKIKQIQAIIEKYVLRTPNQPVGVRVLTETLAIGTDIGSQRGDNQDRVLFAYMLNNDGTETFSIVLCDGMGGLNTSAQFFIQENWIGASVTTITNGPVLLWSHAKVRFSMSTTIFSIYGAAAIMSITTTCSAGSHICCRSRMRSQVWPWLSKGFREPASPSLWKDL